uniref:Glycosyltransferase n=1 Tax=Sinningia cardinalis TaxID=189007 RepID=D7URL6_9LAMI|nr:glucosyltransferase [Sinningia cardinalis]
MKIAELVIIPAPGLTHLMSTVEAAKLLLERDDRLSITLLVMKYPNDTAVDNYTQKISSNSDLTSSLRFLNLPDQDQIVASDTLLFDLIDIQIVNVRDILCNLVRQSSPRIAGIVTDMFCTKFIDVANEFHLPTYIFFTSGTCSLSLFCHLASLKFEYNQDLNQYKNSDAALSVPCLSIPVPVKVFPAILVNGWPIGEIALNCFKRFEETRGIMVNTFYELESYAIQSLSDGKTPKIYPIGPVLNFGHRVESSKGQSYDEEIKKWLDDQPDSSVVFLCFGSKGSFEVPQLKEIASALEKCGHRFLWSIRKPGPKGIMQFPTEYENFQDILPDGFLERTKGTGKLIGWAPQLAVLSHPAVGGFVSHCGWNSTLESIWCGVPVATFPLHAEQQLNAFELVKELGMAEAIRLDYNRHFLGESDEEEIVGSEEIEAAIRRLMAADGSSGIRQKVKEMQKKSRMALLEGGSSYNSQNIFIDDVIKNIS